MTHALRPAHPGTREPALRAAAVVGLAVDAAVHLKLAPRYDALGTQLSQGALFRVEAALAVAAALFLLASRTRAAWRCAGLIALAGTLAILVTRYLELPAVGPVPPCTTRPGQPRRSRSQSQHW